MEVGDACSLTLHINRNSHRYSAHRIDFGERAWVILRDAQATRTAPCEEPILDIREYLYRENRKSPLHPELYELLESWLNS